MNRLKVMPSTFWRFLGLSLIVVGAGCILAGAQSAPFSVSIRAVHDTVNAGTSVEIEVITTNISDHIIGVEHSSPVLNYIIDVRGSNNQPVAETRSMYDLKHPREGNVWVNVGGGTVPPGGHTGMYITLSDFYDMSRPGLYSIQVSRCIEKLSPELIKSNTITVAVTK